MSGSLIFGIGTQSNNGLNDPRRSSRRLAIGNITTTFNGPDVSRASSTRDRTGFSFSTRDDRPAAMHEQHGLLLPAFDADVVGDADWRQRHDGRRRVLRGERRCRQRHFLGVGRSDGLKIPADSTGDCRSSTAARFTAIAGSLHARRPRALLGVLANHV